MFENEYNWSASRELQFTKEFFIEMMEMFLLAAVMTNTVMFAFVVFSAQYPVVASVRFTFLLTVFVGIVFFTLVLVSSIPSLYRAYTMSS